MGNLHSCCIIKNDVDDIDGYDIPFSNINVDNGLKVDYESKDNITYKTVPGPPIINSS
jgi:hypothetical protein